MNQNHFHGSNEPVRNSSYCHFHLKEEFIGVCPLCLNERLLTLASLKQKQYIKYNSRGHSFSLATKILSLGSHLNWLEPRSQKTSSDLSCKRDSESSCISQEDSFISIKFEENGVAYWDRNNNITDISKDSNDQQHSKKHSISRGKLSWRKQIRQLFNGKKQRTDNKNGKQESRSSF